ncbi:MDR family MFS transporter [Paenibacillus sedimenti]|uniref:MFS transporter n=1 Tax=Paenibacillus sedimenti TaxID=2770274 RepID=A0A926KRN8_9BACL|nr:MFS transporter [Paenibacillus sedimenti]MBD0382834.1 MFS transporter [Paenibacillus sedimenti]
MEFFKLHPNIRIRIFTSFLNRSAGTMIFPFMAIYFSEKLGQGLAGILLLITLAAQVVMSVYGGYLSDLRGRKVIMVSSLGIQFIALSIMTLANSSLLDSAWLTFTMMLVQSACNGMMSPAADAMLIDVSTKEDRSFMYAIQYWSVNLSVAIGSVLGGLWFASHRFELFVMLTLACLITLILTAFRIEETYQPALKHGLSGTGMKIFRGIWHNYTPLVKDKLFMLYSLGGMLLYSIEFQTTNYIGVRLEREFVARQVAFTDWFSFELTGMKVLSLIQIENTVMVICLSLFITKLVKAFKDTLVLYSGALLYTIGYCVVGFSNSLWLILFAVLLATAGELLYHPVRQSYLAEIVKEDARSSYMAVNGLVFQLAQAVGALGISIGAVLSSGMMSSLYFVMGISGLILIRWTIVRLKGESRSSVRKSSVTVEA